MTYAELYGDQTGKTIHKDVNYVKRVLSSLQGAPKIVKGTFDVSDASLESLHFAPMEVQDFLCDGNYELKSLEGAPVKCTGNFSCTYTEIKDLVGSPAKVGGDVNISNCNLPSLKGCPVNIGGDLICKENDFGSKENLLEEIMKNKVIVMGNIESDYGTFPYSDVLFYFKNKKLGKFRDFLDL